MEAQALAIAKAFFPDQKDWQLQLYGQGLINQTWRAVAASKGDYILQKINAQIFSIPEQIMHNLLVITRHLQKVDYRFQIIAPVASPAGKYWLHQGSQDYWRAFPFLKNTCSIDQMAAVEQAFVAAQAYGHFAKSLADLPLSELAETIPNFHNCTFRHQQLQEAIRTDRVGRLKHVVREIRILQNADYCREFKKAAFPLRLSHNDTKLNNLLFDQAKKQPLAIIDLDTVMPASPLFDFGDMARTFCNTVSEEGPSEEVEMHLPYYRALQEGFESEVKDWLTPAECAALPLMPFLLTQVQAQRFLTDYLNGDLYYKVRHPEHNLQRCRNQIALLTSMQAQKANL